jgi:two-component system sensor histidine kinase UhpB
MSASETRSASRSEQLEPVIAFADKALNQSRAIMAELAPPTLRELGLVQTLRWWSRQVTERYGLELDIVVTGEMQRLDYDVEAMLFQVVKELLQNVVEHAKADRATVEVHCYEDKLEILVADNGIGFDPESLTHREHSGFGLFSIRERMLYMGGSLRVESAPGRGTRVRTTLPLPCQLEAPIEEMLARVDGDGGTSAGD